MKIDLSRFTNKNGIIPWWFIVVTAPLPGITIPMIAFNTAVLAKSRA